MSLEFHLTHYERFRKEGIAAHKSGDAERARFCFLKSAEHLFQVAQKSDGRLKEERSRRAGELVQLANEVKDRTPRGAGTRATGDRRERENESEENDGDRFMVAERPDLTFDSIAGLDDVKEEIRLKIIYPYLHADKAERYGVRAGGGILLYGPPGTGKTMLARAVAAEVDCAFFNVKPSEILSKWVGEAEKNMAELFKAAREQERAVIFIDEVEALAPQRTSNQSSVMARLVPQILAELEGFGTDSHGLLFIGATNEPWSLDPAIVRPGRFDERVYVGLPDRPARHRMLELYLEDRPLADDIDLERLAELLEGYSGADIKNICRKAADTTFLKSIESDFDHLIDQVTLLAIVRAVKPSVLPEQLKKFHEYRARTSA